MPRSPSVTETKAEQHEPVVAGEKPLLPADLEQPDLGAPSEGPSRDKEEGPVKAPKRPRLGSELAADSVGSASNQANIATSLPSVGAVPQKPLGNPGA
eukprot:6760588-Pyramimonas_sp.AAC.1